jgi:hypothetical protein
MWPSVYGLEIARETRGLVLDPAVDLAVQVGDRGRERAPCGQIDARSRAELVVAADREVLLDAELAGRRARDEVDGAARRVATEQRPCGPSEHLDALDVRDIETVGGIAAEVDAVEIDADSVVDLALRIVRQHPADAEARERRAARLPPELEVRDAARHAVEARDVRVLQYRRGQCRDGDGHVLQAFLTLLGGDDDLFEPGLAHGRLHGRVFARRVLRRRERRTQYCCDSDRNQAGLVVTAHAFPPPN